MSQIPVSILDRANAREGHSETGPLHAVVDRAQRAEKLGYHRFWVAEHHGVPGIAGSAPTLLMAAAVTARTFNDSETPAFVLSTGQEIDIAARAGLAVVLGGPVLFDRRVQPHGRCWTGITKTSGRPRGFSARW